MGLFVLRIYESVNWPGTCNAQYLQCKKQRSVDGECSSDGIDFASICMLWVFSSLCPILQQVASQQHSPRIRKSAS